MEQALDPIVERCTLARPSAPCIWTLLAEAWQLWMFPSALERKVK